MRPLSMDLRERIVAASEQEHLSIRKIAKRFAVNKNTVERLLKQKRTQGHLRPRRQGGAMTSPILEYKEQLLTLVEQYPDATLAEYCELLADETGLWVSVSTMCQTLKRLNRPRKKNTTRSTSGHRKSPTLKSTILGSDS